MDAPTALAARLDRLFRTVRTAGEGEPSYAAVAEAIREQQDFAISHTYIWQLRTGRRDNPTIQHLTALATYFGVPVNYFLDDEQAERIDRELTMLATLREAGVTEIALRSADLSPSSREAVSDMIAQLWKLENPDT
jgi:transcriptional regulator with XRE-family HTH domain